ncbi:MAG: hypothetical protein WBF36_02800, partial [Desulfobulbales bacterium]
MKKIIIFLACLLVAAPFAVAGENESPPGQEGIVLIAQLQTPDQDQLRTRDKDQLQTPDQDQLRTRDKDQLQTPDQDQL